MNATRAPTKKTATKKTATTKTATKPAATKPAATKKTSAKKTSAKKTATKETAPKKKPAPRPKKEAPKTTPAKKAATGATLATAITPEAQRFIAELGRRQDRAWFLPRKDELKRLLHEPVLAVLKETGARLLDAFPAVEDVAPRVFRIHRDVRFSKDKAPYKDHVGGTLQLEPNVTLYVHVDGDGVFAAVGAYQMEPATLQTFRRALADTPLGPKLLAATRVLTAQGFVHMSIEALTRAPAGLRPTHPVIELLRHKGYTLKLPPPPPATLRNGQLPGFVAAQVLTALPALRLLRASLAAR
jgi:uncharacterized protein (TIGR02453 family)